MLFSVTPSQICFGWFLCEQEHTHSGFQCSPALITSLNRPVCTKCGYDIDPDFRDQLFEYDYEPHMRVSERGWLNVCSLFFRWLSWTMGLLSRVIHKGYSAASERLPMSQESTAVRKPSAGIYTYTKPNNLLHGSSPLVQLYFCKYQPACCVAWLPLSFLAWRLHQLIEQLPPRDHVLTSWLETSRLSSPTSPLTKLHPLDPIVG